MRLMTALNDDYQNESDLVLSLIVIQTCLIWNKNFAYQRVGQCYLGFKRGIWRGVCVREREKLAGSHTSLCECQTVMYPLNVPHSVTLT